MMRTLWAGVTGLQAHQAKMDVIGNNIANVNTVGFKKSEVVFEDLMSQTMAIAHGPSEDGYGGTNAMQVGLGVKIGAISQVHTQGQMQTTGKNTDLAISGNGFFVLAGSNSDDLHYTRNGSFQLDGNGNLVSAAGGKVQGWMAEPDAATGDIRVNASSGIGDIEIKVGETIPANETSNVVLSGNLDSNNKLAIDPMVVEYTNGGVSRKIQLDFEHAHPTLNFYTYKATWYENPPYGSNVGEAAIDFNTNMQVQGIIELDDSGQVIGHYRNTDLGVAAGGETDDLVMVNAVRQDSMDVRPTGSTVDLTSIDTPNSLQPARGWYRVVFTSDQAFNVQYNENFDPNDTTDTGWQTIQNGTVDPLADCTVNNDGYTFTIRREAWQHADDAVANTTLYFEIRTGNANGILDLPSEIPTDADRVQRFTASTPEAAEGNAAASSASMKFVNVDPNEVLANTGGSRPAGDYTFRNWRVRFTDATNYTVEWANYGNAFDVSSTTLVGASFAHTTSAPIVPGTLTGVTVGDSAAAGAWTITALANMGAYTTYTVAGPGGITATGRSDQDFNALGISIPAANWTVQPDVGPPADVWSFATADANVWTAAGVGVYNPANGLDNDFASAAHGVYIPEENFSGTAVAGDVFNFRVNYTQSAAYNTDFFTISDSITELYRVDASDDGWAAGGANAGTGELSLGIDASAPQDNWTITINADGTYTMAGTNHPAVTGTKGTDEAYPGIIVNWSGVPVAGDTFTFTTQKSALLSDIIVPTGNVQAESITFRPNSNDTSMNTATGNPITAILNNKDEYQYATSVNVYDSLGSPHTLTVYFERKDTNKWMWSVMDPTPKDPNDIKMAGYGILAFAEDGSYDAANSVTYDSEVGLAADVRPSNLQRVIFDPSAWSGAPPTDNGAGMVEIDMNFADLVQYAAQNDGEVFSQDGYGKGTLSSFTVNKYGYVTGLYDNGQTMDIAQVALAMFNNPAGLVLEGDSLYRTSGNSGLAHIGVAGLAGRGTITGGALEMSNVDLSEEFTNMIVTQRGFQASSRSITTADQMLQELLALKR